MFSRCIQTLMSAALLAGTAATSAATLTLNVIGVEKPEGALMIAVFDSAEAFDNGGDAVRGLRIDVDSDTVTVAVEDLPPGRYAVKMYHDANANGEMDTNMMGMPSESYGFSGNKGRFGPPPFKEAVIDVTEDGENATTIKLR